MRYSHFMLDLETYDTAPTAAIIQIACVPFEFDGTIAEESFCINVSPLSSVAAGGTISQATLKFWQNQPTEVQYSVLSKQTSLVSALADLDDFIKDHADHDFRVWSHATFDPPVLQSAAAGIGRRLPIKYWQFMDIRTLEFMAGNPEIERTNKEMKHNALADCLSQIDYVVKLMRIIKGETL